MDRSKHQTRLVSCFAAMAVFVLLLAACPIVYALVLMEAALPWVLLPAVLGTLALALLTSVCHHFVQNVGTPLAQLELLAGKLADGHTEECSGVLADPGLEAIRSALSCAAAAAGQQQQWLEQIAGGDISFEVPLRSEEDGLNRAIRQLLEKGNATHQKLRQSSVQLYASLTGISRDANHMMNLHTMQASCSRQLSATMDALSAETGNLLGTAQAAEAACAKTEAHARQALSCISAAMAVYEHATKDVQALYTRAEDAKDLLRLLESTMMDVALSAGIPSDDAGRWNTLCDSLGRLSGLIQDISRQTLPASAACCTVRLEKIHRSVLALKRQAETSHTAAASLAHAHHTHHHLMQELATGVDHLTGSVTSSTAICSQNATRIHDLATLATMHDRELGAWKVCTIQPPGLPHPATHARRQNGGTSTAWPTPGTPPVPGTPETRQTPDAGPHRPEEPAASQPRAIPFSAARQNLGT